MSGRGILRSPYLTVPNRRIAEAIGRLRFFSHTASQQQQSNLVTWSNDSSLFYPLDYLALQGVKHHLSSMASIFLAPISDLFGSIPVPERRLSLSSAVVPTGRTNHFQYEFVVKNKRGATIAHYQRMSQQKLADLLTFIMDSFDKFQQITICMVATLEQGWPTVSDLCVAVEESGPIDVRSFHLHIMSNDSTISQPIRDLIMVLAPSVRHLKFEKIFWKQEWPLAIGACQQLRSLDLQYLIYDYGDGARALLDVAGLLPRLNTLHIDQRPSFHQGGFWHPLTPAKHSLILDSERWLLAVHEGRLQAGAGWTFNNFLQRITTFTIPSLCSQLRLHPNYMATLDYIISSMTSPQSRCCATNTTAHVIISTFSGEKPIKTPVLLDWMRMVSRYRVIITLKSNHRSPTLEKIAHIVSAVADNNAENNNVAIHGLDLPIEHQPGAQTFSFFGGGSELRLCGIE